MNIRTFIAVLTTSIALLVCPLNMLAQNFIKYYNASANTGSNNWDVFYDVEVLASGNYLVTGYSRGPGPARIDAVLYSPTGDVLLDWRTANTHAKYGYSVAPTTDGGFAIAGEDVLINNPNNVGTFYVLRFNAQGDTTWSTKLTALTPDTLVPLAGLDIRQTADGGFIIAGRGGQNNYNGQNSRRDGYVVKLDAQGQFMWDYRIRGNNQEEAKGVIITSDGGYLISGMTSPTGSAFYPFVAKLDANGNEVWFKKFNSAIAPETFIRSVEGTSGNYHLAFGLLNGSTLTGAVLSINNAGDSTGLDTYGGEMYSDIKRTADGGYVLAGYTGTGSPSTGNHDLVLSKLDGQLNQQWRRVFPGTPNFGALGVSQAADGGFLVVALFGRQSALLKTDPYGNIPNSTITGFIYADLNGNCTQDANEIALPNNMVQITAANGTYYGYTDSIGQYTVTIYDTGTVSLSWYTPNSYWGPSSCQSAILTLALIPSGTLYQDFYAQPSIACSDLAVTITNPYIRRCAPTLYRVQYCNRGTEPALNSYVEINLDPYLIVTGTSIPWSTPQTGHVYRFDLGTVDVGECGYFFISGTTDCANTVLGQTHCVGAHIYPDTICVIPDSIWDGSFLVVKGECIPGDTVNFTITNLGNNDMTRPSRYIIVEDNVMFANGQVQLNAGEIFTYKIKGNGATFTMLAEQCLGYPGRNEPMCSIEGCGVNDDGTFSTGFVPQFPQDNQTSFTDKLCLDNIGPYDPNDKIPAPLGIGPEGYINATQPLDYTIRFQNTGTDTAFLVVLRDTLPAYLDITTLQLTGASHPYTFQIIGSNVLQWTFQNILLPDSNINEPASHGYVSFHVKQVDGNPVGTEIKNRAGIYFDFNPPIITNYTLNTITEDFKTLFTLIESPESVIGLALYPNPNNGTFSLGFAAQTGATYEFAIYDLAGAKRFGQTLEGQPPHVLRPELSTGMYIYQLLENGQPVNMGKLVVE